MAIFNALFAVLKGDFPGYSDTAELMTKTFLNTLTKSSLLLGSCAPAMAPTLTLAVSLSHVKYMCIWVWLTQRNVKYWFNW